MGYFTVNPFARGSDDIFRMEWLEALPAIHETEHVRHVRFPRPFIVKMDGLKSVGVIEVMEK